MLDPATVQILFADLQPAIVARSKTNPPQSLSCAAAVLTQCARIQGHPRCLRNTQGAARLASGCLSRVAGYDLDPAFCRTWAAG